MDPLRRMTSTLRWIGAGVGIGVLSYAAYAGVTWLRYGHTDSIAPEERDVLLDRFMPSYEVAERHHVRVDAPAAITSIPTQQIAQQASTALDEFPIVTR